MNIETSLVAAAALISLTLVALITSILSVKRSRTFARAFVELEHDFDELSHDCDTLSQKSAEQGRRIAWLETRVRPQRQEKPELVELAPETSVKPNITERRHRVMTLVRRGQDAHTISQLLGMHRGEVELMINLGHAA